MASSKKKTKEQDIQDRFGGHDTFNNSPIIGRGAGELYIDEDDKKAFISKAITEAMEYWDVKPVRTSEEAFKRTEGYFQRCALRNIRPTVEEYAFALGVTRNTLWRWENGIQGPIDSDIIKRAKEIIAIFDAKAVTEGRLNPVTYIFRSKNYYGLKDQQDVVVSANTIERKDPTIIIQEAEELPD